MNTVYSNEFNQTKPALAVVADSMCDTMDKLDKAIHNLNALMTENQKVVNRLLPQVFSASQSSFHITQEENRKEKIRQYRQTINKAGG